MASVFGLFFAELFAFRIGSRMVAKSGLAYGERYASYFPHAADGALVPLGAFNILLGIIPCSLCSDTFPIWITSDVHIGGIGHTHNEAGAAAAAAVQSHHHVDENGISLIEGPIEEKLPSSSSSVTEEHVHHPHASHSHSHPHAATTPKAPESDVESGLAPAKDGLLSGTVDVNPDEVLAQLVGIAILEFGVVLHSTIIGLTLAVDDAFRTLFVVIIFHRESLLPKFNSEAIPPCP